MRGTMLVFLNLSTDEWNIIEDNQEITNFIIKMGFIDNNFPPIFFESLAFGCKLMHDKFLVWEIAYPGEGIKYISTDQEYVESFNIHIDYETEYNLLFWAINNGKYYQTTYNINVVPSPQELISDFDSDIEEIFNNAS